MSYSDFSKNEKPITLIKLLEVQQKTSVQKRFSVEIMRFKDLKTSIKFISLFRKTVKRKTDRVAQIKVKCSITSWLNSCKG